MTVRHDLLRLTVAKLREVHATAPDTFDLNYWQDNCGTVGCAAFHASKIPEIAAEGFRIDGTPQLCEELAGLDIKTFTPLLGPWKGQAALGSLYGLNDSAVRRIFYTSGYIKSHPTAADVADRIEDYIV